MVLDPDSRLGATQNDSNNIGLLKKHRFFKGIDFDMLKDMLVPFSEEFIIKPKEIKSNHPHKLCQRYGTVKIIKFGILEKKSPWFHYNTRRIVLDNSPKIEYKDPDRNTTKVKVY